MISIPTFLTTLYCLVDDFCKTLPPEAPHPGEAPSLSRSEVVALSIFGQWARFQSERDFYRFAEQQLRSLFPTLPNRSQFNRLERRYGGIVLLFSHHLSTHLTEAERLYEAMDCSATPTRNVRRRGAGWLPGQADIGKGAMGWFEGFRLLMSVSKSGVITGFAVGAGHEKDQPLAESFLFQRAHPQSGGESAGIPGTTRTTTYLTDSGFVGADWHERWLHAYGAEVISPPQKNGTPSQDTQRWSKALRRWVAGLRQVVESVFGKLQGIFRLRLERPHTLEGFLSRLAAKVALHNLCIWLNDHLGRPRLAFADLLGWA
jgi:hypothetical protein